MNRPIPGLPLEQQNARILLTCLGYGEARNQTPVGVLACLMVALNRAYGGHADIATRFHVDPEPLRRVILAPKQFSCFNHDDPNRELLLLAWKKDPDVWGQVATVVELALGGMTADPTHGARNYFTTQPPVWAKTWPPSWGLPENGWVQTAVVGAHTYGKAA